MLFMTAFDVRMDECWLRFFGMRKAQVTKRADDGWFVPFGLFPGIGKGRDE